MLENGGMVVEGDLSVGDEGDNRFAEGTGSIRVSDVDSQS
jgi:flagellar basal body L-ring protein FlgH